MANSVINRKENPFFSIIIPIYNVEKFLDTAVESVLKQTFQDFELILVDDGSQDNCPSICEKYAAIDDRISVIHKQNGGLVDARKSGVFIAKGKYSLCLDGDDWLHLLTLQKVYEKIITNHMPDIISFRLIETDGIREKKNTVNNAPGYYSREDIVRIIFPMLIQKEDATYFAPSLCGKAIKTELYRECQQKVDSRVVIGEDGACTIPCVYNAEAIYIMEDYLYYYRTNINSVTKSKRALSMDMPKYYADSLKSSIDIKGYDFEQQLYRKIVHDLFFVIVSQFNRKDSFWRIREEILNKLKEPLFSEAIERAEFRHSLKAWMMMRALRWKIFVLFKVYYWVKIIKCL